MTLPLWILAACASAVVMALGSRAAIRHAVALAEAVGAPPFAIGVTLVAVGTDIPEIVNSVIASYSGHGDITLGDATGSVFTQITFGLGLLPLVAGTTVAVVRRDAWLFSVSTLAGLALGAALYGDGSLSRLDAVALSTYWIAATAAAWSFGARVSSPLAAVRAPRAAMFRHAVKALAALTLVGGASAVLVGAVAAISAAAGMPEYALSFFGAAIATSLPELAVELTAIRAGQREIALGDVLGSCLVDATLAVGIGPLLFPTVVTASLAHRGAILAALAVALAGGMLIVRGRHDRSSAVVLLAAYLIGCFAVLV